MTPAEEMSPKSTAPRPITPASRARYRLLTSMLTTYSFGLVALSVAPMLFPVWQPPAGVTIGELMVAFGLLSVALLIAPRGQG